MQNITKLATFVAMAFGLVLASAQPAYAYIDPGSGSFVLQVLGMSIVSGLFFFRQFFYTAIDRLKSLRDKLTGRPPVDTNASDKTD